MDMRNVCTSVLESEFNRLAKICIKDEARLAAVIRKCIIRGLPAVEAEVAAKLKVGKQRAFS